MFSLESSNEQSLIGERSPNQQSPLDKRELIDNHTYILYHGTADDYFSDITYDYLTKSVIWSDNKG